MEKINISHVQYFLLVKSVQCRDLSKIFVKISYRTFWDNVYFSVLMNNEYPMTLQQEIELYIFVEFELLYQKRISSSSLNEVFFFAIFLIVKITKLLQICFPRKRGSYHLRGNFILKCEKKVKTFFFSVSRILV